MTYKVCVEVNTKDYDEDPMVAIQETRRFFESLAILVGTTFDASRIKIVGSWYYYNFDFSTEEQAEALLTVLSWTAFSQGMRVED